MEILAIIFGGALLLTLFAPWIGAEDRPDFRRPDRKPLRRMTGSMRSSDWGRDSGWPF
jgi:hypothetical protein